jgi:hypothetical protein
MQMIDTESNKLSYHRGHGQKASERKQGEKGSGPASYVCTQTHMHVQRQQYARHHSYVRISRFVFSLSPCVFAPFSMHACMLIISIAVPTCAAVSYDTAATLGFLFFSCRCRRCLPGQYAAEYTYVRTVPCSRLSAPCASSF